LNINITKKLQLTGHKGPIYALCQGEQNTLYSCSNDLHIVKWNLLNPNFPKAICKIPSKAFSFTIHQNVNQLIIGTFKGMLRIVDLNESQEIKCIELKQGIVYKVVQELDRNRLHVLTEAGILNVFNLKDYSLIKQVKITDHKIRSFMYIKELDAYFIGAGNGSIYIINPEKFNIIKELKTHLPGFGINAMLSLNNQVVSGSRDAHLMVRNLENPDTITNTIPAHNYAIYDIVTSPNKNFFATCSMDKTIKIWDAFTFEILTRIDFKNHQSHSHSVNCLLWDEFGLISASDDGKIMVWDYKNGQI